MTKLFGLLSLLIAAALPCQADSPPLARAYDVLMAYTGQDPQAWKAEEARAAFTFDSLRAVELGPDPRFCAPDLSGKALMWMVGQAVNYDRKLGALDFTAVMLLALERAYPC
jgi:hypothetical protein